MVKLPAVQKQLEEAEAKAKESGRWRISCA